MTLRFHIPFWIPLFYCAAVSVFPSSSAQFYTPEFGTSLTLVDYINAERIPERLFIYQSSDPLTSTNPRVPQLFEGDIHLNNIPLRYYTQEQPSLFRSRWRNAIRSPFKKWEKGEIPILVSSKFSTYERSRIAAAVREFEKYSCVRFIPRVEQKDYVYIHKGSGCYSLVGRHGGKQPLSVGLGCMAKGIIMHELMHSAGFFHEQSRADRDDFIDIVYDNVMDDAVDQFQKYSLKTIDHLDAPYDYGSIMHYGSYAFSKNKKKTVVPRKKGMDIGQRRGFSPIDIQKINSLYQCSGNISILPLPTTTVSAKKIVFPGPTTPSPPVTSRTCADTRPDCHNYLHKCHTPKGRLYCSKTCHLCDSSVVKRKQVVGGGTVGGSTGGHCTDIFPDQLCRSLKGQGYCISGILKALARQNCCHTCRPDEVVSYHYHWG